MATHHGRPGGRLLEVGLAFALITLSAVFFVGVMGLAASALDRIIPAGAGRAGGPILMGLGIFAAFLLKFPWNALLKYYRYEAHTLRPLTENEIVAPRDGREKNEG